MGAVTRWLVGAAMVGLTILLLHRGVHMIGIDSADDTMYLRLSAELSPNSFIWNQSWGPLYKLWCVLLAHICPDPFTRYFLSWRILAVSVAWIPVLLRIPGAWLYTIFLVSLPLLTIGPFVSLFAAAVLVCGLCLLLLQPFRTASDACLLACLLSFAVAFARPEYGYGVLIACGATWIAVGVESFRRRVRGAALFHAFAKLLIAGTFAFAIQYVQAHSAHENRSGMAFLQHFNIRASEEGRLKPGENPFLSDYGMRAFALGSESRESWKKYPIGAYLAANPRLFMTHMLTNARDSRTIFMLALLAAVALWPWFSLKSRRLRATSLYLLLICLPPLAGMLIIYPREHYAIVVLPSILLFTLQLTRPERWPKPNPLLLLAGACLVLVCLRITQWRMQSGPYNAQRDELEKIECLRSVDRSVGKARSGVVDLEGTLSYYVYPARTSTLPPTVASVPDFANWASQQHPAWVVSDPSLQSRLGATPSQIDDLLVGRLGYTAAPCASGPNQAIYADR